MLSIEQQKAYDKIIEFFNGKEKQQFCLAGYAGTGKTFLAKTIIENFLNGKSFKCCAPTGKAAYVLQDKLQNLTDVTTIHKLLYSPVQSENKELTALLLAYKKSPSDELLEKIKEEKKKRDNKLSFTWKGMDEEVDYIIVDESSMVDEVIRDDLLGTGAKVLFIGDPGQLPPVKRSSSWFEESIDFKLNEIQRQALDSPIIRLSMDIRNNSVKISQYQYEDCRILRMAETDPKLMFNFDQVITGKNITRHMINRKFRSEFNYIGELPNKNERIICLKNMFIRGKPIVNGQQGTVTSEIEFNKDCDDNYINVAFEDDIFEEIKFYDYFFKLHYIKHPVELPFHYRKDLLELDYSYAITAHKSQGSEWDSVYVMDDKMQRDNKTFRTRWLYTAVTRAKNKLVWVI